MATITAVKCFIARAPQKIKLRKRVCRSFQNPFFNNKSEHHNFKFIQYHSVFGIILAMV
jgi:hypothetical protein